MEDNIFIGILLLVCIIFFVCYYKKTDYFGENVTNKMITILDNDIALCFDPISNPNPTFQFFQIVDQKFVKDNLDEILDKMKGITIPGIILMVRFVRLYSLDFICKNTSSSDGIINFSALFLSQIKQLINLYNKIFNMVTNIGPASYDDKVLFKQIVCLTKSQLRLNDQNILSDYDSITYPESMSSEVLNTYSIYIYSQSIYDIIINISQNKSINYCTNISLSTPQSILPIYRMHPDGDARACKAYFFPKEPPKNYDTSKTFKDTSYEATTAESTIFSPSDNIKLPIYVHSSSTPESDTQQQSSQQTTVSQQSSDEDDPSAPISNNNNYSDDTGFGYSFINDNKDVETNQFNVYTSHNNILPSSVDNYNSSNTSNIWKAGSVYSTQSDSGSTSSSQSDSGSQLGSSSQSTSRTQLGSSSQSTSRTQLGSNFNINKNNYEYTNFKYGSLPTTEIEFDQLSSAYYNTPRTNTYYDYIPKYKDIDNNKNKTKIYSNDQINVSLDNTEGNNNIFNPNIYIEY